MENPFKGARKARPTILHRPALWEMLLGTVVAMNDAGETKYFDYDYEGAREYAGVDEGADLRLAKFGGGVRYGAVQPSRGQLVLWVKRVKKF